ncbi:FecR family protein [Bacteroides sp.]
MRREIPWDLIITGLKGTGTADDDRKLMDWLADSNNQEVFEELRQVWQKVQAKVSDYTPDNNYYWKELSKRMKAGKEKQQASKTKILSLSHLRRYAAVACVLLIASFSLCIYIGIELGHPEMSGQKYTNLGGKSVVSLPDGTQVWLHNRTSLAYNTDFKSTERQVNVTGEAYFDVTHDKKKPFIVQTDGMKIVVHGTKFNVESFPDSEQTFVSLIEGSVSLETNVEKRFLVPGETATFNKKSHSLRIAKGDVEFSRSWADDQIVFKEKSLGYVCRFLAKWYNVKIELAPELTDKYMYTFTLRNETLEEILRLMSRINPIEYRFDEDNQLIITPGK